MALTLRLYTDFVCPFCFIAEQSTVPRLLETFDIQLDWRGFELHPGTPRGGTPLATLFPGVDLARMHNQTRGFAARFGVTDFNPPDRIQNSRRALAMAEYARYAGHLEAFRAAAFEGHWRRGLDLEDLGALRELAGRAGLDPEAAVASVDDPATLGRVDEKQEEARRQGITGIPTFVLGHERVVGCQPFEALAAAARRAGAEPRTPG
jgi:predicted DsbA family dithiol-disulfide isomerase